MSNPDEATIPDHPYVCDIEDCGKTFPTAQRLGMHRWHSHQIRSTTRGHHPKDRSKRKYTKRAKPEPAPIAGEDLVAVVLEQMFPKGIPVAKLPAVMSWHDATVAFLKEMS